MIAIVRYRPIKIVPICSVACCSVASVARAWCCCSLPVRL
jgi:hypothetical protein